MERRRGIVIRYGNNLCEGEFDTIAEHNKVFARKGVVYIGKFGKPLGRNHLERCNSKPPTKLILVKREGGQYLAFVADIAEASRKRPSMENVPAYYGRRTDVSTWFKLASELKPLTHKALGFWFTSSSHQKLTTTLATSMAGFFYAYYDPKCSPPLPSKRDPGRSKSSEPQILSDDFLDFLSEGF